MTEIHRYISSLIKHRPVTVVLGVIAVLAVVVLVVLGTKGSYPIAFVDGTPISAHRFETNYTAALAYYANLEKSFAENATATAALAAVTPKDIGTKVLDQLVEAVLIERGARTEVGGELSGLVREKVGPYDADASLRQSAETLYSMAYADFRSEILVPQAERDILAGRLYLANKSFEEWIAAARTSASVRILSSAYRWEGGKVVAN